MAWARRTARVSLVPRQCWSSWPQRCWADVSTRVPLSTHGESMVAAVVAAEELESQERNGSDNLAPEDLALFGLARVCHGRSDMRFFRGRIIKQEYPAWVERVGARRRSDPSVRRSVTRHESAVLKGDKAGPGEALVSLTGCPSVRTRQGPTYEV